MTRAPQPSDKIIVFVGPSLSPQDRSQFPKFLFRGPAARGDFLRILADQIPRAIGLIDGYFGDRPSVLHKEILQALAAGVSVIGGASMGALRAAELSTYGMVGVGAIFRQYRDGALVSDAAVAVSHGPEDLRCVPLSVAEVDVLATIESLVRRGHISSSDGAQIRATAAKIHFTDRTWAAIAEAASACSECADRLEALLTSSHVQAKRLDAIEVLRMLQLHGARSKPIARPSLLPPMTPSYIRALAETA